MSKEKKGVMVNKKLQGNGLQVEQEWDFLGRKHSRLMYGDVSCSAFPSHVVAVLLWICLSFIQSFPEVSSDETPSLSLGDKLFWSVIPQSACFFILIKMYILN